MEPVSPRARPSLNDIVASHLKYDIYREDLRRLNPDRMLDDSLVCFYLSRYLDQLPPDIKRRICIMDSLLFQKVTDAGDLVYNKSNGSLACIFTSEIFLIPVCKEYNRLLFLYLNTILIFMIALCSYHWSLIFWYNPGLLIPDSLSWIFYLDSKGKEIPSALRNKFQNLVIKQLDMAGRTNNNPLVYDLSLAFIQEVKVPQQPDKNYVDCGCYLIAFARVIMDTIRKSIEANGENVNFTFYDEASGKTNAEVVERWIEDAGEIVPNAIRNDIRREIERK